MGPFATGSESVTADEYKAGVCGTIKWSITDVSGIVFPVNAAFVSLDCADAEDECLRLHEMEFFAKNKDPPGEHRWAFRAEKK